MALKAGFSGQTRRAPVCRLCSACCREMIVPVNDADVRRLAAVCGLAPERIVGFYGSRHVEYDEKSRLWIRTRYGMRIMALRRSCKKCRFLSGNGLCRVYARRPSTCRTFPHEIHFRGKKQKPMVECSDWKPCRARPGTVTNWPEVLRARRREIREDAAYGRLLRLWESSGTGNIKGLLDFLFPAPASGVAGKERPIPQKKTRPRGADGKRGKNGPD